MPRCSSPSRCSRFPRPAAVRASTEFCSRMPARIRASTYSRDRFSRTTESPPRCASSRDSSRPAGPAPMIPTWVRTLRVWPWGSRGDSAALRSNGRRRCGSAPGRCRERGRLPPSGSPGFKRAARRPYRPIMTGTTSASGLRLPRYLRENAALRTPVGHPDYKSTGLRAPLRAPVDLPHRRPGGTGPRGGGGGVPGADADLPRQHDGEPQGQRIIVHGRVLDSDGRPVPDTLIEVWQANAGGRYRHVVDNWPSPVDPNFSGLGRVLTDSQGRYEFITIKPGAYPWGNHDNAWRPAHIHFSLFGRAFTQRLVTQMYFPGDPLFFQDPIFNSIPEAARPLAVSRYDHERTVPSWALAFQWDIVLRGREQTPFETEDDGDIA